VAVSVVGVLSYGPILFEEPERIEVWDGVLYDSNQRVVFITAQVSPVCCPQGSFRVMRQPVQPGQFAEERPIDRRVCHTSQVRLPCGPTTTMAFRYTATSLAARPKVAFDRPEFFRTSMILVHHAAWSFSKLLASISEQAWSRTNSTTPERSSALRSLPTEVKPRCAARAAAQTAKLCRWRKMSYFTMFLSIPDHRAILIIDQSLRCFLKFLACKK